MLNYFSRDILKGSFIKQFWCTSINFLLCSHLMWLLSFILPYRMVGQHLNELASTAIRRWLSFSWELGPIQTFRTRWEQDICMQTWVIESDILYTLPVKPYRCIDELGINLLNFARVILIYQLSALHVHTYILVNNDACLKSLKTILISQF